MPRIPDIHLQCVVFIYPSEQAAHDGMQVGGSGFIVNYPTGIGNWRVRYVLTNQHVVDGGGHWVRLNRVGGTHIVHIPPDRWISAPEGDDFALAYLPLPPHVVPFEIQLDDEQPEDLGYPVTRDEAARLRVGPGDEVYMVGRFVAHAGRVTNNPIARFGSVALMPTPDEPVLDGRRKEVEAYLVEMRSHAGFSGSPVFLLIPQGSFRGEIGINYLEDNKTRFRILGIDTGHKIDPLPLKEETEDGWQRKPGYRVEHYSDVAIVAPIWKVLDLLRREDFAEKRREIATDLEKRRESEIAASDTATEEAVEDGPAMESRAAFESPRRKVSGRKPPGT